MSTRRQPEVTSRIMAAVLSKDTAPEVEFRRALHRAGLRYRLHVATLLGHPDVVFPRQRVAIFIDGDYWHGQSWRARGFRSLEQQFSRWNNGSWWLAKIRANVERDRRQTRSLRRQGWTVLRFRDSSIQRDLSRCVAKTLRAVRCP